MNPQSAVRQRAIDAEAAANKVASMLSLDNPRWSELQYAYGILPTCRICCDAKALVAGYNQRSPVRLDGIERSHLTPGILDEHFNSLTLVHASGREPQNRLLGVYPIGEPTQALSLGDDCPDISPPDHTERLQGL